MIQDTLATVAGGDISVELQVSERETPPACPLPKTRPSNRPQSRAQSRSVARNAAANRETPLSNSIPVPSTPSSPRRRTASPTRPPIRGEYPAGPTTPCSSTCLGPGEKPSSPRHWHYVQENYSQHRSSTSRRDVPERLVDALRCPPRSRQRRYRECDLLLMTTSSSWRTKKASKRSFPHLQRPPWSGKQIVPPRPCTRSIRRRGPAPEPFPLGPESRDRPPDSRHAWRSCGPRRNRQRGHRRRRLGVQSPPM